MSAEVKKEIELELAHVLFIDIVGYSKVLINVQRALLDTLNQIVRSTEEFRKAEATGRLIKIPAGDGMALVFYTSPEAPAECALEIARADIEHTELKLRMGIHSGLVSGVVDLNERANVAGAGINMAQLVMDCGDAGHILISKRVAEDLEQYGHWRPLLHDLGECEVKDGVRIHVVNVYTDELGNPEVPEKFKAASVAAAVSAANKSPNSQKYILIGGALIVAVAIGLLLFRMVGTDRRAARQDSVKGHRQAGAASLPIPEKSIAVLSFENLSSDKENAYFADGIQDEILTRLSKIADLKVISRTSTQHYKSTPENLPEIARRLGVAHILEGSVQKSGDAVRVNVQLIKAATDSHLWADIYDRKLTDIFSVESEVAKAIAEQLRAHLSVREEQVIAARPTDNSEAYDVYLRGLAYTQKSGNTPANTLGAQKYLSEAVRLDPKFALSWALLSYVDARGYLTQNLQPTVALREEARQAAETALTLQPNLGEALLAKGYYHYACLKDYDIALRYFEQARQLLPNSSRIPESLAYVTRRRGQWDRSESYFNEAERLDPRNVNRLYQHAISYVVLRRFPEAVRKFDQVLDITPDDVDTLVQKAAVAQAEGDLPRAAALLAPLHPAADKPTALETQVYQAILERRSAQIIPRLKEILAEPDPALGYLNGELRFWLGWAQEVAGDDATAQESWRQARSELEPFLKEQPGNYSLIGDLALTNAGLGDKAAALALAERAMATIPIDKDAVDGPGPIEILARVAACMRDPDRATAALQKLLSVSYQGALAGRVPLTPALLRLDPMFDPLRNNPRFQKLVASSTPEMR
jgi:TolB-like protein/tetratricopeptide (TPR) repeat protein/class 3 adenylate cyclase